MTATEIVTNSDIQLNTLATGKKAWKQGLIAALVLAGLAAVVFGIFQAGDSLRFVPVSTVAIVLLIGAAIAVVILALTAMRSRKAVKEWADIATAARLANPDRAGA